MREVLPLSHLHGVVMPLVLRLLIITLDLGNFDKILLNIFSMTIFWYQLLILYGVLGFIS